MATRIPMLEPLDEPASTPFEIICHRTGDRAHAVDADQALYAAGQLVDDALEAAEAGTGRSSLRAETIRRTITIVENGSYQGILTELARAGWRGPAA